MLIAEKLFDEGKTGPLSALMQSLSMLVCTEGNERSLSDYTHLLCKAGFAQIEGNVSDPPLDAILALKG